MAGGEQYSINQAGSMVSASVMTDSMIVVILTGYMLTTARGTAMYQTTGGTYIDLTDGWQETGTSSNMYRVTLRESQSLVDRIIRNNQKIIANNLLCARFANKLTSAQRQQVRALQQRLMQRDGALRHDGICTNLTESYPSGYAYLQPSLESIMDGSQDVAGVGSLTVTIVVSALVVAALSTAAYFAYKRYADESDQDVKFSQELTKSLVSKLTPEEYQQLLEETKGIVTKARIKASLGSYYGIIKYAAVGLGAWALYRAFKTNY